MSEINIQRFYRNNIYSGLFAIVGLLNLVPFIFFLIMKSPAGVTNLGLAILFFYLFSKRNSPILTISAKTLIYQASVLGQPVIVPNSKIENSLISGGKIIIKVKDMHKPVTIVLSNFNKIDRDSITKSYENIKHMDN